MHLEPVIHCQNQNCQEQIRLPYPTPPDITAGQPDWPLGEWTEAFVCLHCGHVYDYSEQNIHWAVFQSPGPSQPQSNKAVWCARFECVHADCEPRRKWHVEMDSDKDEPYVREWLDGKRASGLCPKGHEIIPLRLAGKVYRLWSF